MSLARVPIRNIYFLLCYAFGHAQEARLAATGAEECDRGVALLARMLARSVSRLLKQGLHRDYLRREEELVRPRGKIHFTEDIRRPRCGRLLKHCEFDELDADVLANQIIATVLRRTLRCADLEGPEHRLLHKELRELEGYFENISALPLTPAVYHRVQMNQSLKRYRFALSICKLLGCCLTPTQGGTGYAFNDFLEDDARMGELFEQFVRNLLKAEQDTHLVSSPHISWDLDRETSTARGIELLPTMRTDIVLERVGAPSDKTILDCKFYREAFQERHGTQKFISAHLYQVFSYMVNQSIHPGWERTHGVLLYPAVGQPFDETVTLRGHSLRVMSVCMDQEWETIMRGVLGVTAQRSAAPPNIRRRPSPTQPS